jgi:hypothetical protein
MRRLLGFILVLAIVMTFVGIAAADNQKQSVEAKLSDVIANLAINTQWGNVYFRDHDIKRLTHAAANLKPINLGDFTTDGGAFVLVQAIGFSDGNVTFVIKKMK